MNDANKTYTVGTAGFDSFMDAVNYAKSIDAEVFEAATGKRRWYPIPKSTKKAVKNVLVVGGVEMAFTKANIKKALKG